MLQTNEKRLEYLSFYLHMTKNFNLTKAIHFVLYLEIFESLNYPKGHYELPDLIMTPEGFSLKQVQYDFQENAKELYDTLTFKNDVLDKQIVLSLGEEMPLYYALFLVKIRSVEGLNKKDKETKLYQKIKLKHKPYKDISIQDIDKDYIESLVVYPMDMVLNSVILEIDKKQVILTNSADEMELLKDPLVPITKIKEDIQNRQVEEPYVYTINGDDITFEKELSGL